MPFIVTRILQIVHKTRLTAPEWIPECLNQNQLNVQTSMYQIMLEEHWLISVSCLMLNRDIVTVQFSQKPSTCICS